jgi:glucan biosynthesis protein
VAFLGGSYFRAIGELFQYGLSARGLAVDTAVHGKIEEFPDFTHVYFETPQAGSDTVVVCALLDGASVSGAFRFTMRRAKAVIIDVEKALYLREDIDRLGIAPLTSMYWYSEKAKPSAIDWRPEIHDSDGLALWTGTGERIWRPLNNPPRTITSAFSDENPKGFGLLQRDRAFDHYLDGVYYDRRPSLWVEPQGSWGKGSVQLVEIPTDDEIHDNIVAMWVPAEAARAGQSMELRYRTTWSAEEPFPTPLARVLATRLGNGGQAGTQRPKGVRKFMVEFKGEPLTRLAKGEIPKPVLWAPAASSPTWSRKRCRTTSPATGAPISTSRPPARSLSRCAAICASGIACSRRRGCTSTTRRCEAGGAPSSRFDRRDLAQVDGPSRMPQVVCRLHRQPNFGSIAEELAELHRHGGGDGLLLVENAVEALPRNPE